MRCRAVSTVIVLGAGLLCALPRPAYAIPAFARKYGTSCATCHTVYPKLNPFGEAFRRNGFRFPGTDSDFIKQDQVVLERKAYKKMFPDALWPSTLPGSVPLAYGVNGQIAFHPDKNAGAAKADNKAPVVFDGLVDEAHLWAGGSFDDSNTFFGELTVSADGIEIEHALVLFNDLVGPAHLVNLTVGRGMPTLSTFGGHSSYIADMAIPGLSVTAMYAANPSETWMLADNYNLVELHGTVGGRFSYSVGLDQGANAITRPPRDVYAHIGYKIGGVRLDGEDNSAVKNPMKPWAENALTIDLVGAHSSSRFDPTHTDNTNAFGGALRAQWQSLELDAGAIAEYHSGVDAAGTKAMALSQYDELSYVVYPWLVPAVRLEYTRIAPDGGTTVSDLRITPGVDALIRANLKLTLAVNIESANGAPPNGWDGAMGSAMPSSPAGTVSPEVESIMLGLAYAL